MTWLTTIAPRTVSQSTLDSTYEPKVRRWIVPQLGKHRLDRLQPEHLDAFYMWLAAQGLKPNTTVQIHRIVSRALKVAWKRGKVARNVASMVDAPIGEDVDIEPLTQEEARQILRAAASRRNGARWSVALAVGIRQSEAIGLRWQFVDLDAGTIEVGWQLKRARYRHGCQDAAACAANRHRVACPQRCTNHSHQDDCLAGLHQARAPLPAGEAAMSGRLHRPQPGMPAADRRRLALHPSQRGESRPRESQARTRLTSPAHRPAPRPSPPASGRASHRRSGMAGLGSGLLHPCWRADRLPRRLGGLAVPDR